MTSPEQFTDFYQSQGRVAQRYAAATMEGAQRIFSVQMEASRDVLSRNGDRWRDAMGRIDPVSGVVGWPALVQAQMECAIDMARTTMEGTARVCEAYVRTLQDQGRAVADAYRDTEPTRAAAATEASADAPASAADLTATVTTDPAGQTDRAAEEVGRQAAEAVALMTGQPTGSVAAAQSESKGLQRRGNIIRP